MMSANNRTRLAAAVFAAAAVAACAGDGPTDPASIRDTRVSALGLAGSADVLVRARPLAQDVSATAVIGPRGGRLEIAEAGVTLEVPAGAVMRNTAFTLTALGGDLVAYEFGPHGSRFALPLRVTQQLDALDPTSLRASGSPKAGYFPDRSRIDFVRRRAAIDELLPATVAGGTIAFQVRHFSGYMVSSGTVESPKGSKTQKTSINDGGER